MTTETEGGTESKGAMGNRAGTHDRCRVGWTVAGTGTGVVAEVSLSKLDVLAECTGPRMGVCYSESGNAVFKSVCPYIQLDYQRVTQRVWYRRLLCSVIFRLC